MEVDLSDLDRWARSSGLEIVMLATGSVLVSRGISWAGARVTHSIKAADAEHLVATEMSKHRHALTQVVTWVLVVSVYCVAAVVILTRFNVPLSSLAIPATTLGVAFGLGAQRIVADLLAGIFMIGERQFGFGDEIRIAPTGSTTGVVGVVEEVTLRVTRLRTLEGEQLIVPNGEIRQVTNLSRDWARAVVDIPVPAGTDVDRVTAVLEEVGAATSNDDTLSELLLGEPQVMGVQSIGPGFLTLRMTVRTLPGKQFTVARALRARVVGALLQEGIDVRGSLPENRPGGAP